MSTEPTNIYSHLPAIMQTHADASRVSAKYDFIPTTTAIDLLAEYGYFPVAANQVKSKTVQRIGYAKHAIKFERQGFDDEFAKVQLLLRNAHDGASSFQLLQAAHIRLCSNGVVSYSDPFNSIRVLHKGFSEQQFIEAIIKFTERAPLILDQLGKYRAVKLSPAQMEHYATKAIELRFDPVTDSYGIQRLPVAPQEVLRSRRYGDSKETLYDCFNRVQENLIDKGGVRGRSASGRRFGVRAVTSVDTNISLNQKLWKLTSDFYQETHE